MNFKKIIKPYIIAEIGVNHENSLNLAEKIIKQAKIGNASAVKFQTYKADKIACKNSPYYWDLKKVKEKSQFKLFKKYDKFNKTHYVKLKKICDHYSIDFLSTPFDHEAVEFLNKLVPFFKVASADVTNIPLIEKICKTKKPILMSTGACDIKEIYYVDNFIKKKYPKVDLALMHCVLSYPTKYSDANLNLIKVLKKKFPHRVIGYSDHTMPDKNSQIILEAFNLGAVIIEKHFTLDKYKGRKNNDHFHSMDFNDLFSFWKNLYNKKLINKKFKKLITGKKLNRSVLACEKISRQNARRSIVTNKNFKKGDLIKKKDVICKRPGTGISPIQINDIIGKKVNKNIPEDSILLFSDLN
jgi:sialic acid synthase SpsE